MEIPIGLEETIALESQNEFLNQSNDFGERLFDVIMTETGKALSDELIFEFNSWWDIFVMPEATWGDFVRWVWRKIVEWWNKLWD